MAAAAAPACVVCGDVAPADACLACARGHVLCGECLNGLARAALAPDTVREAGGVVRCPWRGQVGAGRVEQCAAPPWTHATLAPLLTRETSAAVSAAALAALDVAAAEAARVREELAAAGARGGGVAPAAAAAAAGGGEGRAERMARYRRTVIDDVLTLRCPRCRLAFVDYQGCDALTCGGCGCPFCALCLAPFPTGHAAHQHVGAARHHADGFIGLHGGLNRFRAYHAQRQRTAIDDFVARLREPDDFKDELVRTLVNDGELHGVPGRGGGAWGPPDAAGGGVGGAAAAGDNGAGAWWRGLGGLVVFAAELMGPRENQGAFTRGVRAVLDLALLAAPLLSRAAAPAPANAAADAERRKRTSTATTVAVAAGAAAVVAGGAAWAIASAAEKEKAERERRERGEDVD